MPEPQATPPEPKVSPLANLDEWLNDPKNTKPAADAKAEPAAAPESSSTPQPQTSQPSWRDQVIGDDAENEFFRGKKVGDLFTSYDHAQRAMRDALTEKNELKRQLEIRQAADAAVQQSIAAAQPKPPAPADPREAEIDEVWFSDPARARFLQQQIFEEKARTLAAEEARRIHEQATSENQRTQLLQAGYAAWEQARTHLQIPKEEWDGNADALMYVTSTKFAAQGGPLDARNVVAAWNLLHPQAPASVPATPPTPVPAVPQQPKPPGSGRPAAAAQPATPRVSTVAQNALEDWGDFAQSVGVPKDRFMERLAR